MSGGVPGQLEGEPERRYGGGQGSEPDGKGVLTKGVSADTDPEIELHNTMASGLSKTIPTVADRISGHSHVCEVVSG